MSCRSTPFSTGGRQDQGLVPLLSKVRRYRFGSGNIRWTFRYFSQCAHRVVTLRHLHIRAKKRCEASSDNFPN